MEPTTDFTKLFLFMVLAIAVLLLAFSKPRPLASTPLAGSNSTTDIDTDGSDVSRGPGFANAPSATMAPPLSLMMPTTGMEASL